MNLNTIHYLNVFLGMGAIVLQIVTVIVLAALFFGANLIDPGIGR